MKWLFRIFLLMRGCRHKWLVRDVIQVYETAQSPHPYRTQYIMNCAKCGDIMARKV